MTLQPPKPRQIVRCLRMLTHARSYLTFQVAGDDGLGGLQGHTHPSIGVVGRTDGRTDGGRTDGRTDGRTADGWLAGRTTT